MSGVIRKETFLNPEDYPEDQRRLVEDFNAKLKNSMGIITGIGKEYHTIWLIDRKDLSMELYRSTGQNTVSGLIDLGTSNSNYESFIKAYVETYVADRPESILRDISYSVVSEKIMTGGLYTIDYMRINDDSSIAYHQMAFALAGSPDTADKFILAFRDVDKVIRRHMADKLYLREQLNIVNALSRDYYNIFKIDIESGNVVILKLDGYVTKGMEKPSEKIYPYDVLYRQYVTDRVYSEDIPSMMEAMSLPVIKEKLEKNSEYVSSYRVMDNGEIHYYQFTYIPINPLNKAAGILAAFKNVDDIVESARERDELKVLAETDTMTGILNRGSGEQKINVDLASGKRGMFCVIDIDEFKSINDNYGHDTGDKVIRGIADILKSGSRERDIIFRLGGDEYAIFAPNVMRKDKGRDMINRIFENVTNLDIPELKGYTPTISVGAVIIPHGKRATFDDAYRKADECVYKSKNYKGNYLTFHDPETAK
ncbi:MAG: GGDEF domain-containing protein [Lachnospiraceae bacterium]|nr:GGDEF domain-containing protein [Lachnospiraceae bacterium]